ncbi:MAG: ribosomal L7Ae/L30e/S12e/Gadd45 family protein [Defluviitaleaceae bacterium]|nr:ribosomal L7Ae/L30e/S12e/Gadd45 family protein [Defluviitaleaceae bacterium]
MDKKIFSLLSICQKAGKIKTGEDFCVNALRSGEAKLVIIAEDASENTKKKFTNKSTHYGVPFVIFSNRDTLSQAIGKINRPVMVITDGGLAEKINAIVK